jgi:hypothetical protein
MKELQEANDAYNGMFPVNINKGSIPAIDLQTLRFGEEDIFRVYNISSPKSIEILGAALTEGLIRHSNPVAPINALYQVRVEFNQLGYDFDMSQDRIVALKSMTEGHVDFPLFCGTSALYPYQIDQTFPGQRIEDDGIERKLGYKLIVRIHVVPTTYSNGIVNLPSQVLEGEIIPQE